MEKKVAPKSKRKNKIQKGGILTGDPGGGQGKGDAGVGGAGKADAAKAGGK